MVRSGSPLGVVPLRGLGNVGVEFLEAAVGLVALASRASVG